jgi:hypothetical protein
MSELTGSFATDVMQAPVVERRAWVRRLCSLETSGRSPAQMREIHWFGTVIDLSPGGMRLLLNRRFEIGTVLEIEIPLARLSVDTLAARVIHINQRETGEWLVGCVFESALSPQDLKALLNEASEEPQSDF